MNRLSPPQQDQAHRAWQAGQRFLKQGRVEDAVRSLQAAHRIQPRDRVYTLNLAQAYLHQRRPEQASDLLEGLVKSDPRDAKVLSSLLQCLELAKLDERLIEIVSGLPDEVLTRDNLVSLGQAQVRLHRHLDAVSTWMRALSRDITHAATHVRLGYALYEVGMQHEAAESLRTALALGLGPAEPGCTDMLRQYEREVCDWRDASERMAAWQQGLQRLDADAKFELSPFCHAVLLDDPELQLKAATVHSRYIASRVEPMAPRKPVTRSRIRVGYLSSDFYNHATSLLMAQLLEQHDRRRFEVFAYSYGVDDGGECRKRITSGVEHFIELSRATEAEMAQRIRDDEIDILVDLKGYTRGARPQVMAARPAPVQVAYLGYPGTMGADFIDYVIGDRVVTPIEHASHFSEKIAQLPGCYQCNDGTRPFPVAPSRASQGLPDDALVLCGFNNLYKISPEVFDVWCGLLQRLPQAVLWLVQTTDAGAAALHREAQARGVNPSRLIFAPRIDTQEHLNRLACADLFIDTWPCNGHTSVSDALWAGVPVVTLSGSTFASRVAGSLLEGVGLGELTCTSIEAYEESVIELAQDQPSRAALRARLEAARTRSPLFDGELRAREIEALYLRMWERALEGLPPEAIPAVGNP